MGKIVVIPGGGAHGAEVVGVLATIRKNYDVYIGTSTGALIALLAACGKWDELIKEYTNTNNADMYGPFRPFKNNGKLSKARTALAFLNMIRADRPYMFDISKRLERKIRANFTYEDFDQLRRREVQVIVTAEKIDVTNAPAVYFSNLDAGMYYDKFVKCLTATAAIPFLSRPVEILGERFLDGGVLDPVPSDILERFKGHDIDVWLMHNERDVEEVRKPVDGGFSLAGRLLGKMRAEIKRDDIEKLGKRCNVYYSTFKEWNSANFNKMHMRKAYEIGVERANKLLQA